MDSQVPNFKQFVRKIVSSSPLSDKAKPGSRKHIQFGLTTEDDEADIFIDTTDGTVAALNDDGLSFTILRNGLYSIGCHDYTMKAVPTTPLNVGVSVGVLLQSTGIEDGSWTTMPITKHVQRVGTSEVVDNAVDRRVETEGATRYLEAGTVVALTGWPQGFVEMVYLYATIDVFPLLFTD